MLTSSYSSVSMSNKGIRSKMTRRDVIYGSLIFLLAVSQVVWVLKFSDMQSYLTTRTLKNSGDVYTLDDCYERDIKPCDLPSAD